MRGVAGHAAIEVSSSSFPLGWLRKGGSRYTKPAMKRSCPHPDCHDGVIVRWSGISGRAHSRSCPRCHGTGVVCELHDDLRAAGIVPWGTTAEDFRSAPTTTGRSTPW